MTLPTADRAPRLARQTTRDVLATWRLTPVEETVVLLVSELVIKAARRARGTFAVALELQTERTWLRIEARDADPRAEVVILDLEVSGKKIIDEVPGLAAAGQPLASFPGRPDPAVILAAPGAGACACATRNVGRGDRLAGTILTMPEDRAYVTRSRPTAMLADRRSDRPALSAQERQALLLWFQGMSKASVASRMLITENTVRQYINRARAKYATAGRPAPSKDALLARAIEDGIIRPGEVALYTSYASRQPGTIHVN
jgi:DNA-binding CsgD family transcriptional regulator